MSLARAFELPHNFSMNKINKFYANIGINRFYKTSAMLLFTADLVWVYYLVSKISDKELIKNHFEAYLDLMKQFDPNFATHLPPNFYFEVYQLFFRSTIFIVIGALLIHALIFYLYYKRKAFAKYYATALSVVGGIGTSYFFITRFSDLGLLSIAFLGVVLIYLYTFIGLRNLVPKT